MVHSAGAHLVALLSASPSLARPQGVRPWLGAVLLDSAVLNTPALMRRRHARFYDRVFGSDPALWRATSPFDVLAPGPPPMLLVCSTKRRDSPCAHARQFAARVETFGGHASVLPEDLSHAQINAELGQPGAYTSAVDDFMASLGAAAAGALSRRSPASNCEWIDIRRPADQTFSVGLPLDRFALVVIVLLAALTRPAMSRCWPSGWRDGRAHVFSVGDGGGCPENAGVGG